MVILSPRAKVHKYFTLHANDEVFIIINLRFGNHRNHGNSYDDSLTYKVWFYGVQTILLFHGNILDYNPFTKVSIFSFHHSL